MLLGIPGAMTVTGVVGLLAVAAVTVTTTKPSPTSQPKTQPSAPPTHTPLSDRLLYLNFVAAEAQRHGLDVEAALAAENRALTAAIIEARRLRNDPKALAELDREIQRLREQAIQAEIAVIEEELGISDED